MDASELIALNSWVMCYVEDKFRIQIRVSEAPIGSFQFVFDVFFRLSLTSCQISQVENYVHVNQPGQRVILKMFLQ